MRICSLLLSGFLLIGELSAQTKLSRADRKSIQEMSQHLAVLAHDSMEGRRAGTPGESRAGLYISTYFESLHLEPKGQNGSYLQTFDIPDGRKLSKTSFLRINGKDLSYGSDFSLLSTSGNGVLYDKPAQIGINTRNQAWISNISTTLADHSANPHFDLQAALTEQSEKAAKNGALALLFYGAEDESKLPVFDPKYNGMVAPIPVILLSDQGFRKIRNDPDSIWKLSLDIVIEKSYRKAQNVIAYLDRKAPYTFIIGAHYDHLGRGEDGNSMIRSGPLDIHNGADDNASGTTTLLDLAKRFKSNPAYNTFNILFIAFSAEELGLLGSRYFTENPTIPLQKVSAMINMDMVGRLQDSSQTITIGGYGTSPLWKTIFDKVDAEGIQIKFDSSGTGPSDHTSFYRKDIPVLFFFTGLHTDYHKPSDDADKINTHGMLKVSKMIQHILAIADNKNKLPFTRTREQQSSTNARFTVSMGIMPDYSFSGNGVRIDGVSDGRPAKKIGILAGDILVELGTYKVSSVESYMQALSKFKKGDTARVVVLRNGNAITYEITF